MDNQQNPYCIIIPQSYCLKLYKEEWLNNYNVLLSCTTNIFLYHTFPIEIIILINRFFLKLCENYVKTNINTYNICKCDKIDCINEWYNGMDKYDFRYNWDIRHCNGCHYISCSNRRRNDNPWTKCETCSKKYCLNCIFQDKANYLYNYCIYCRKKWLNYKY